MRLRNEGPLPDALPLCLEDLVGRECALQREGSYSVGRVGGRGRSWCSDRRFLVNDSAESWLCLVCHFEILICPLCRIRIEIPEVGARWSSLTVCLRRGARRQCRWCTTSDRVASLIQRVVDGLQRSAYAPNGKRAHILEPVSGSQCVSDNVVGVGRFLADCLRCLTCVGVSKPSARPDAPLHRRAGP
jgi:hypothetical protein